MSNPARYSWTIAGNGNDRSDGIGNEQTKPDDGSNVFDEFTRNLTTLPYKFKNLRGTSITVDTECPSDLIELLGNILEITDYPTNMVSFWFLDMLAFQVLQHYKDFDGHHLGVLISWLTGEMTLLRDRKYSREEFFKELQVIFMMAANEVSKQGKLLYWDDIVDETEEEEGIKEETQGSVTQIRSAVSLQRGQIKETQYNLHKPDQNYFLLKESTTVDPLFALGKVIESTYDIYADELRYALVYAVFVEPIELKIYNLPFVLRTPRPIKFEPDSTSFSMQLHNNFKMMKGTEKSKDADKKKAKAVPDITATPPSSLDDEDFLMCKRFFILPLLETNEAFEILNVD